MSEEKYAETVRNAVQRGKNVPAITLVEPDEAYRRQEDARQQPRGGVTSVPSNADLGGKGDAAARQLIPGARVRVDPASLQATSRPFFRPGDVEDYGGAADPVTAPSRVANALMAEQDADIARVAAQYDAVRAQQEDAAVKAAVGRWFDRSADPEVQADNRALDPEDRESAQLRAADGQAILQLVRFTPDKNDTAALAARKYFSRYRDPGLALSAIAHDYAQQKAYERHMLDRQRQREAKVAAGKYKGKDKDKDAEVKAQEGLFDPAVWNSTSLDDIRSPADRLLRGLGREPGASAMEWVQANLTPETAADAQHMAERRATRDHAGYRYRNLLGAGDLSPAQRLAAQEAQEETDLAAAQELERQKPKRRTRAEVELATRAAIAEEDRAVRRSLEAEERARARAFARDSEQARVASLLTREAWGALPIEERTKRVQEWRSLRRMGSFSFVWPTEAHPQAGALLRAGRFAEALGTLARTAATRLQRRLARALTPRLQNVRSQIVPAETMNRVLEAMGMVGQGVPAGQIPGGVYIWPASAEKVQQLRAAGLNDAADIFETYNGQILFNEAAGVSAELTLHEAVHAAADAVLNNRSHPITKRLEQLRSDLIDTMGPNAYGLSNVNELLAHGMTDPEFRRRLGYVGTKGQRLSTWDRFRNILRDFMRSIMGLPPGPPGSGRDIVDRAMDDILALGPTDGANSPILGGSFSMNGAKDALKDIASRMRVPTAADGAELTRILRDTRVPTPWKDAFMRLFVPLEYVADNASKYFSVARGIADAVGQHQAQVRRLMEVVNEGIKDIGTKLRKFRAQREMLDNFNNFLYQSSLENVDVRKPRSTYANDPEKLMAYNRLQQVYLTLPQELRDAANIAFGLPAALNKELDGAIRERIAALAPGNRALQSKIYGAIYEKIYKANLIDPYAALRRSGPYWVSYTGTDPLTGNQELFKHAFETERARDEAVRRLQALESGIQKDTITTYMNVGTMRNRPQVPMEFVANVLDTIDKSAELANLTDPNTGESVKEKIIELMFDTLPETSFVHSFRRREGVKGFIGDFTPFTQGLTYGDTLANIEQANTQLARQVADLRFGARFAAMRSTLEREFNTLAKNPAPGTDPTEHAYKVSEAARYHDALRDFSFVPFQQRAKWSRRATGMTYMLTLGFNASTALITLSQVPLYVAPFLAGKHGIKDTTAALGMAHRLLAGSGRTRTIQRVNEQGQLETTTRPVQLWDFSLDNYDVTRKGAEYLAPLQDVARRNGVFNHSLIQDQLLGEQATMWEKMAGWSGFFQHHAERYSRETALLSAYHLELKGRVQPSMPFSRFVQGLKDGGIQPTPEQMREAAEAAVETSEKVNGPIYAAAGPLASRGDIGSILYLFKRHPLSMLNLIVQTVKRSNPFGDKDQVIAFRQSAMMLGMMSLMAGAMGLPFMQQVGWLYDLLLADDDEPDFATAMRMGLGELGSFGALDYLTGMRVSERIGLSGAIYRPGFASEQLPFHWQLLEGIGGPVVGMAGKYLDRVPDLMGQGEFWRAAESAMPTALGNMLRAYRFAQEGDLTMRGDPITGDIGPYTIAAQALGFMSAERSQQLAVNSARVRMSTAIDRNRSRLLQRRNIALRENDWATVRDIDTEILEFNQRHPEYAITADTRRDSWRSFVRTSEEMMNGVSVNPRLQPYINEQIRVGAASWMST